MLNKRIEVLFDEGDYLRLQQFARQERKSVGQLLREAAAEKYLVPARQKREAALARLLSLETDLGSWAEMKTALERRYPSS